MGKTAAAERLEFEGEAISETVIELKGGKVSTGPAVIPKGAELYFIGQAKCSEVSFPDKDGATIRSHKLNAHDLVFVDETSYRDMRTETQADAVGTPAMLSTEGEVRRAAREAIAERDRQVRQLGHTPESDDKKELVALLAASTHYIAEATNLDVDETGEEGWFEQTQDALTKATAVLLAATTYVRRRQDEYLAAKQREAAEESARIADEARKAAAVHSKPDGQREDGDEPVDEVAAKREKKAPAAKKAGAKKRAAGSTEEPDGPSSQAQRVALTKNIAGLTEGMTTVYVRWVEAKGWSLVPAEMTFDQARQSLEELGDHEAASAT